jgi:dipeptidyl aminopeptidase/acylaminoacyl peptidase
MSIYFSEMSELLSKKYICNNRNRNNHENEPNWSRDNDKLTVSARETFKFQIHMKFVIVDDLNKIEINLRIIAHNIYTVK